MDQKAKLTIVNGSDKMIIQTNHIAFRTEGLEFYDPTIACIRVKIWDKIDNFTIEGSVSEEMKKYSRMHVEAYSDTNTNRNMTNRAN